MGKGLEEILNPYQAVIELDDGKKRYYYREEQVNTIEKELKALEIIKKYGHLDNDTGDLIVHIPDGKNEDKEYDLLKEVLL